MTHDDPMEGALKMMEDAEMLAGVRAYDAARARLESDEDELYHLKSQNAGCAVCELGATGLERQTVVES
jgi:hypothetical protein